MGIEKNLEPPKNGLLVLRLIPVAYEVLEAWKVLIKGVSQLLHVVPCTAAASAPRSTWPRPVTIFRTARAERERRAGASTRRSEARSTTSSTRSAGGSNTTPGFGTNGSPPSSSSASKPGDIPEYPSRRRTNPILVIGRKVIGRSGFLEEPDPLLPPPRLSTPSSLAELDTAYARHAPPAPSDVARIARETMEAYEVVRSGVTMLLKKYTVKACGYCSEVHVGPWGHNVKLCGEFKHRWRDGKHGWQDAVVDEVFPPNYVWHVNGPPLRSGLRRFYGKAPAVVELCLQAGAKVPDRYKPVMRLDIVIPYCDESRLFA